MEIFKFLLATRQDNRIMHALTLMTIIHKCNLGKKLVINNLKTNR